MSTPTTTTSAVTSHLTSIGDGTARFTDRTLPPPASGEVRIRICATAVNPVDPFTRAGAFHQAGIANGEVGLGWDMAGTIEAIGDGVDGWAPGDAVIAIRDDPASAQGAHGEAIVLPVRAIGRAPRGIAATAACTLALNALTARQALDLLDLRTGATLLITGAGGAVGGFAVELAKLRGLQVLAQASDLDADWLRSIGADTVIGRDGQAPGTVDAALDAASLGSPTLQQVRDGGAFVGVLDQMTPSPERGIAVTTVHVHAQPGQLDEISQLAEQGKLTLRVSETLPLSEAERAYAQVAQGGLRGRVILVP